MAFRVRPLVAVIASIMGKPYQKWWALDSYPCVVLVPLFFYSLMMGPLLYYALCDGELKSSISMHYALELCFECDICSTKYRDKGNIDGRCM